MIDTPTRYSWLKFVLFKSVKSHCAVIRSINFLMGLCLSKQETDEEESDNHFEFAGGNVHLITTKEGWEEKLSQASRESKIVVANFSAAWCGPCRTLAPLYSELSEKYPALMFLTIDVDELTVSNVITTFQSSKVLTEWCYKD
ncbi:hypothetical protein Ancab_031366 [Ancistrocladus abbreviatus]